MEKEVGMSIDPGTYSPNIFVVVTRDRGFSGCSGRGFRSLNN